MIKPPKFTLDGDLNSYTAERHHRSGNWVISHGRVCLFEFTDEELGEFIQATARTAAEQDALDEAAGLVGQAANLLERAFGKGSPEAEAVLTAFDFLIAR